MIQYRDLSPGELSPELFAAFVRRQVVTDCWRREGIRRAAGRERV